MSFNTNSLNAIDKKSVSSFSYLIILLFSIANVSYCQSVSWNGSVSSDWFNPNNWSPNAIPTAGDIAVINPAGATFLPEINSTSAVAESVDIHSGASLTVGASGELVIDAMNLQNHGIYNAGTLINHGLIDIQNSISNGIQNFEIVENYGSLHISNTGDHGMYNGNSVTNSGSIEVSNTVNRSISSVSNYVNMSCSYITVDSEILGSSGFTNDGIIISSHASASTIETNTGYLQNIGGGTFSVTNNNGFTSYNVDDFLFTACGTLTWWQDADNWHTRTVPSSANDRIHVTEQAGTFSSLTINSYQQALFVFVYDGANINVSSNGILNINGQGIITDGIRFFNGSTGINHGEIHISNTTDDGIQCSGSFGNDGLLSINNANYGIYLLASGSFSNVKTVHIGNNTPVSNHAIWTIDSASLFNHTCGIIHVNSNSQILDQSNLIVNDGTLVDNYDLDSNIDTNNGFVFNLNGGNFNINTGAAALTALPPSLSWTGFINSDWDRVCNWNEGYIPDGNQDILIPHVTNDPLLTRQLVLSSGSTLQIDPEAILTIDHSTSTVPYPGALLNYGNIVNDGILNLLNSAGNGLENFGGTIVNNDLMILDIISNTSILNQDAGMNTASFTNNGFISLNSTSNSGIDSPGSFDNAMCGYIVSNGTINGAQIANNGSIVEESTGNSMINTNPGIVYNLNGGTFNINSGNAVMTTLPNLNSWTGAIDNNWDNPCNWDAQILPVYMSQSIYIPSVSNSPLARRTIEISEFDHILIDEGASLELDGMDYFQYGISAEGSFFNLGYTNIKNYEHSAIACSGASFQQSTNVGILEIENNPRGINLLGGAFFNNYGNIKIPLLGGPNGIISKFPGFENEPCGLIEIEKLILDNDNSFINSGTIVYNYHHNSTIETNNSFIYNIGPGSLNANNGLPSMSSLPSTLSWTGAENNDWFNVCNWNAGLIPDGSFNIIIPNMPNDPIFQGEEFELQQGKTLQIDLGAEVIIEP